MDNFCQGLDANLRITDVLSFCNVQEYIIQHSFLWNHTLYRTAQGLLPRNEEAKGEHFLLYT